MKKDTALGIISITLILLGVIFYIATKPLPAKAPGDRGIAATKGSSSEHSAYYDIAINYATTTPLLSSVGAEANTAAVVLMQKFANDTVAQFKIDGNFANLTAKDIEMMGFDQGRREKLQIVYMIASSSRTVSYIDTVYMDTLGAHGNTFFTTFTFDTKSGALLALGDAFLPGTRYLDTLSAIARAKLPEIIGKDLVDTSMLNDGTTPKDENFSKFFFDNKDFVILFAPYQVAAYAAGPQTLRIPRSELANVLKPEYR
jgi:hypothetical protein